MSCAGFVRALALWHTDVVRAVAALCCACQVIQQAYSWQLMGGAPPAKDLLFFFVGDVKCGGVHTHACVHIHACSGLEQSAA